MFAGFDFEPYVKIMLAVLIGFLIGWDREVKSKPAGIKTYSFVTVASTLMTIISVDLFHVYAHSGVTMMDPARLAAQIPPALGFIGAGLILKQGRRVSGLTSASMILFAGGIGIAIGAGYYGIMGFSVILMLLVIKLGNALSKRFYPTEEQANEEHLD
ncbi:MgtC/SapB family protein [Ammoniphilus sp. CFH 90114]|uniref:MgtC/SapB family protein n=1 Tax=Ammoniphilus sp. CFH 90114 TaxID=2493665 RepID=UPI001F0B723D|nr:MgtC/SapB family protein [Ammoniphilus sp. CFH 90114]